MKRLKDAERRESLVVLKKRRTMKPLSSDRQLKRLCRTCKQLTTTGNMEMMKTIEMMTKTSMMTSWKEMKKRSMARKISRELEPQEALKLGKVYQKLS